MTRNFSNFPSNEVFLYIITHLKLKGAEEVKSTCCMHFTLTIYLRVQHTAVLLGFSLEVHDGEAEKTESGCHVDEKRQSSGGRGKKTRRG